MNYYVLFVSSMVIFFCFLGPFIVWAAGGGVFLTIISTVYFYMVLCPPFIAILNDAIAIQLEEK